MENTEYKIVSIKQYAKYIGLSMLEAGMKVTPLKLQKILYYQQAWHMVAFGRENILFNDVPQAWINGPVYPVIYNEYKDKVTGMCDPLKKEDFLDKSNVAMSDQLKLLATNMSLTEDEIKLTDNVITLYGTKTQNQLIYLTHSEEPWCEQRKDLMPYDRSNKEISLDTMYNYYHTRYINNRKPNQ